MKPDRFIELCERTAAKYCELAKPHVFAPFVSFSRYYSPDTLEVKPPERRDTMRLAAGGRAFSPAKEDGHERVVYGVEYLIEGFE